MNYIFESRYKRGGGYCATGFHVSRLNCIARGSVSDSSSRADRGLSLLAWWTPALGKEEKGEDEKEEPEEEEEI